MPFPSFTRVTDEVDYPEAADINPIYDAIEKIAPGVPVGDHVNRETLSANKTLTDADYPVQSYDAGAAYDINLPANSSANHSLYFWNRSAYTLTVKDATSAVVVAIPAASGASVVPDAQGWVSTGYNAGGGRTYNAVTVTTANVTAVEGNHYDLTIAGLTAERKFVLPTPSAAGVTVSMRILDGGDTYSVMPQINSADVDGYNLFIAGESLVWRSTGTGAGDWEIAEGGNGKKSSSATIEASTNENIATSTPVKITLDSELSDNANLADTTTNYRINIRRDGDYYCLPSIRYINGHTYPRGLCRLYKNGVAIRDVDGNAYSAISILQVSFTEKLPLVAGDYLELYAYQTSGSTVTSNVQAGRKLVGLSVVEIP